jgi:hypothetical protein
MSDAKDESCRRPGLQVGHAKISIWSCGSLSKRLNHRKLGFQLSEKDSPEWGRSYQLRVHSWLQIPTALKSKASGNDLDLAITTKQIRWSKPRLQARLNSTISCLMGVARCGFASVENSYRSQGWEQDLLVTFQVRLHWQRTLVADGCKL